MDEVILGIDPGTKVTGYGVISHKERKYRPIDFGCIRPPASYSIERRHRVIFEGICHLCDTFQPHALAVEDQFVSINPKSTMKVCMAKAIIILAATLREIPVFEYAPTRAKQAVVGKGSASKLQVQAMVKQLLGLSECPQPEDASDALAIALCHGHTQGFGRCMNLSRGN